MIKAVKIFLIILICLIALGTLYVGFCFFIGSGFIFAGDIDLTEEQRTAAQKWVFLGSLFGFIMMLGSLFVMLLSEVISKKILRLFGAKIDEAQEGLDGS